MWAGGGGSGVWWKGWSNCKTCYCDGAVQAKSIVWVGGRAGVTAKHVIVMGQCRQSPLCGWVEWLE